MCGSVGGGIFLEFGHKFLYSFNREQGVVTPLVPVLWNVWKQIHDNTSVSVLVVVGFLGETLHSIVPWNCFEKGTMTTLLLWYRCIGATIVLCHGIKRKAFSRSLQLCALTSWPQQTKHMHSNIHLTWPAINNWVVHVHFAGWQSQESWHPSNGSCANHLRAFLRCAKNTDTYLWVIYSPGIDQIRLLVAAPLYLP